MRDFNLHSQTIRGYAFSAPAKSGAGVSVPVFVRAHNRASGFFVCEALLHLSMVGCAGASHEAPGSLATGNANSVQSTTSKVSVFCGGLTNLSQEDAAIMATTPTPLHPSFSAISVQEVRHV